MSSQIVRASVMDTYSTDNIVFWNLLKEEFGINDSTIHSAYANFNEKPDEMRYYFKDDKKNARLLLELTKNQQPFASLPVLNGSRYYEFSLKLHETFERLSRHQLNGYKY